MTDILYEVNKLAARSIRTHAFLNDLKSARNRVQNSIKEAEREIGMSTKTEAASTNEAVLSDEAASLALIGVIAEAPDIYRQKVTAAAKRNSEFSYNLFLNGLLTVGDNEGLYITRVTGRGWKRKLTVTLDMDGVAGNINEYAMAVLTVRENFETNGRQNSAETASRLWKRYYKNRSRDGGSTYLNTMESRFDYISEEKPAPYWSLLNDGNAVPMESDWGGTPFPNRSGTHFVQETELALSNLYAKKLNSLREEGIITTTTKVVPMDRPDLKEFIKEAENLLSELDEHISDLENNFENPDIYIEVLKVDKINLDKDKLSDAIARAKHGESIPKNFEIGTRGNRKRVSSRKVLRELNLLDE